jgi:transcriptional regulator with XRE-family HTH domain
MSQEALADKADVSRAYVGKLENAKFSATIDLLQRMAAALDVDISRCQSQSNKGPNTRGKWGPLRLLFCGALAGVLVI